MRAANRATTYANASVIAMLEATAQIGTAPVALEDRHAEHRGRGEEREYPEQRVRALARREPDDVAGDQREHHREENALRFLAAADE